MKRLFIAGASALLIFVVASSAGAETKVYEDEYVSFEYDDETEGFIDRYSFDDGLIYSFQSEGLYCQLNISTNSDSAEGVKKTSDERNVPMALLETREGLAVFLVGDRNGECAFYQTLVDTAKAADEIAVDPEASYRKPVYRHYPYSEQAISYVKKAIEICNGYLDMSIDGKDARKQMEEVEKRAKSYADSTEDSGDEDVASTLFLRSSDFAFGRDAKVIELMNTLQMILDGAI